MPLERLEDGSIAMGHVILGPDGRKIEIPNFLFAPLRTLHALAYNRGRRRWQILGAVQYRGRMIRIEKLLTPEFDPLFPGLRKALGNPIASAPFLVCRCREHRGLDPNDYYRTAHAGDVVCEVQGRRPDA